MVSLAENLHFNKSASIAFVWTNAKGLSPNPYYKQKEITNRVRRNVISFSVVIK